MTPHEAQAQSVDTHQHNKHIWIAQWVYKDEINTYSLICICTCTVYMHKCECTYVHVHTSTYQLPVYHTR